MCFMISTKLHLTFRFLLRSNVHNRQLWRSWAPQERHSGNSMMVFMICERRWIFLAKSLDERTELLHRYCVILPVCTLTQASSSRLSPHSRTHWRYIEEYFRLSQIETLVWHNLPKHCAILDLSKIGGKTFRGQLIHFEKLFTCKEASWVTTIQK